jgi:hypothetical protein
VWQARDAVVVNKQERADAIDHCRLHREISSILLQLIKWIFCARVKTGLIHELEKRGVRVYRHGAPRSVSNLKWEEVTGDYIVNVTGDYIVNVTGDYIVNVMGDYIVKLQETTL